MSNSMDFFKSNPLDEATEKALETLLGEIENLNPALGGFEEIGALLTLPDEQFNLISAIFLDELQKSLAGDHERVAISRMMKAQGLTPELMASVLDISFEDIDERLGGKISSLKVDFLKNMLTVILNAISDGEDGSNKTITIPFEKISEDAIMPNYAYDTDAGMDVYSTIDVTIAPGETAKIPLGFKVAIPNGYYLQLGNKSGVCAKTKMRIANAVGVIDAGYRGEVCALVENIEPPIKDITYDFDENGKPVITSILHGKSYTIEKGQKIGQLILAEVPRIHFVNSTVNESDRGEGGFGSTGLGVNAKN